MEPMWTMPLIKIGSVLESAWLSEYIISFFLLTKKKSIAIRVIQISPKWQNWLFATFMARFRIFWKMMCGKMQKIFDTTTLMPAKSVPTFYYITHLCEIQQKSVLFVNINLSVLTIWDVLKIARKNSVLIKLAGL